MRQRIFKYQFVILLLALFCVQESGITQNIINEKVELTTDRDLYLSGEKILFSAKVFMDNGSTETTLSKIIYLELFKDDKAFVQAKFKLENGFAGGSIQLPNEMLSGNYYLRAYTMLMLNGEPENFYNTIIKVVNPERKLHEPSAVHHKIIEIIPEGGSFIAGIENRACVRFNSNSQRTIENAIVVNSRNDTLSNVLIFESGLGEFTIIPEANEDAWMKIKLNSGDSAFVKLGKAESSGLVLNINHKNQIVKIFSQGDYRGFNLNISLFNPDFEEIFTKEIVLSDSVLEVSLAKFNFEQGVNYLVLKDQFEKVIKVHPFFVMHESDKSFDFELASSYGKRKKAEIEISGLDTDDFIVLSVTKAGLNSQRINNLNPEFIYNPLLLNNNLPKVNYPLEEEINRQIQLSFILNQNLFNSVNFKEKFLNKNSHRIRLPEIRDLSISGIIKNKSNGEPMEGIRIFASVLGQQPQLHTYLSDENGNFVFSLNQLEGIKDVGLTINNSDSLNVEIVVFSDFCLRFPAFRDFPLQIDSSQKKMLEAAYRNQQIDYKFKEIVLSREQNFDTLPYPFQDIQVSIVLADFIELPTMHEVFDEIVTYVNVRKRGGQYYLNVLNSTTETLYNQPLILIDNLPVFNIDKVMKIKPSLVEKIEVITKPYSLGEMGFKGIVMITTKTDDFGGLNLPEETVFLKYTTSSLLSKQLFPEFTTDNTFSSSQPYFSNTIFWDSEFITNENGVKKVFFTSDESGMFEVVVKVIKSKGLVQQAELLFNVE